MLVELPEKKEASRREPGGVVGGDGEEGGPSRVSTIVLNAFSESKRTEFTFKHLYTFGSSLRGSLLQGTVLSLMHFLLYPVSILYLTLWSTIPLWCAVGLRYLFSTGGVTRLDFFLYWAYCYIFTISLVWMARNTLNEYLRARFVRRGIKRVASSEASETDTVKKVSKALKEASELYWEHLSNLNVSLGCVSISLGFTFAASNRVGFTLLGAIVVLYLVHIFEDVLVYLHVGTIDSAILKQSRESLGTSLSDIAVPTVDSDIGEGDSKSSESTIKDEEVQMDVLLEMTRRKNMHRTILKAVQMFVHFLTPLILFREGSAEMAGTHTSSFGMAVAILSSLFALHSAFEGHAAMQRVIRSSPSLAVLKRFNDAYGQCLLRNSHSGAKRKSAERRLQLVRKQSKKYLDNEASSHSKFGGYCIVVLGFAACVGGIATLIVSSTGVNNYECTPVQMECRMEPETNGLRLEITEKQVFSWGSCVFERSPAAVLDTCARALLEAETGLGDASDVANSTARTAEEVIVEGSGTTIDVVASYIDWRGVPERFSTTILRHNFASMRERSDRVGDTETRRLAQVLDRSTELVQGSDVHFATCLTCDPSRYAIYNITAVVDSGRYSGTKNTLSIQMQGEAGKMTSFTSLGSNWKSGEERKIQLRGLIDVGKVVTVSLTTSGKDSVLLKHIYIRHKEVLLTASVASNGHGFKVGSKVNVMSGKYKGCPGRITTFSAATEKPKVCRDCSQTAASGGSCCGSSVRSQCWYYGDDDIKLQEGEGDDQANKGAHESYFSFLSSLKCEGSKRAGTWTCSTSLKATLPVTETSETGCAVCAKPGDQNYQGVAPILASNLESILNGSSTPLQGGVGDATLSTYSAGDSVIINKGNSIYDGCPGKVEKATTKTYKILRECSKSSRKGVECCGRTTSGYYYPQNVDPLVTVNNFAGSVVGPLEYEFGTLWVDRRRRGVIRFKYEARSDCGCLDRHGSFTLAPASSFPGKEKDTDIQQYTGRSYPKFCIDPLRNRRPWSMEGLSSAQRSDQCNKHIAYDRGHLVPANHFDHSAKAIKESNFMINILPQVDKMNRGAWLQTEMIIECLREEEVLTILGGAVYPSGTLTGNFSMDTTFAQRDDWFLRTHGVTNPHYFWKAILADPNGRYKDDFGIIAFWIPNTAEAIAKNTEKYIVSLAVLEERLQGYNGLPEIFDVPDSVKKHVPSYWKPLDGCNRG
jgi:endonuclease G, mitochondrial